MEPMDTSEITIGCGRGRAVRRPSDKRLLGSPPKVAAVSQNLTTNKTLISGPSSSGQSSGGQPSVRPKQPTLTANTVNKSDSLKRAEARSGIPIDFFDNYFKIGADMSRFQNLLTLPNRNWGTELDTKPEPKEEEEDSKKDRKYLGRQYVNEAQDKERLRVKQYQKEEKERQKSSRSESPVTGRHTPQRLSNRSHNMSTLSMQTQISATTNIESVGTYQTLDRMEAIAEDETAPGIVQKYFVSQPRRQKLPISEFEDRIIKAIGAHRVVVIEGATGCGKTTQVPQYIADDCAAKGVPFNIVVTQPRRIAAKSIAARVAEERDWQLGTIIGYQIGMDRETTNKETRLLFCTTGVLLQKLINQQNLDVYSHIVIDEVHERSIETDLLLLVLKKLMNTREYSVKIILMSATFDVTELKEYFAIEVFEDEDKVERVLPTHIHIKERAQDLSIYFMNAIKRDLGIKDCVRDVRLRPDPIEKDAPCVSSEAMEVALHILERGLEDIEGSGNISSRGSVLVFLPGLEEIHELKAKLDKSAEKQKQQWVILPLHSSIPLEKQNQVFQRSRGRERKIILATNIAESSITVPDVAFVVDFCLTKNLVMDMETHIPILRMEWASRSNCEQRAGRAGRCSEGRVFRLVTEQFWKSTMSQYSLPELNRSPLDLSILRVKMLNMGPPKDLLGLALTPPDLADIYHSVLQLKQVGAFAIKTTDKGRAHYEDEDGDMTILGTVISHLPIDIRLGKLICLGHVFDVLEDCVIIAACLSTQGMFRRDFGQALSAYKSRLAWAERSFSDSIAHLNAYKTYKRFSAEFEADPRMAEHWCKQNYIQYKRVKEVDYMVGDLLTRLSRLNILIPERPNLKRNRHEEDLILKVVMCAAFYPNYFTRNELDVQQIAKDLYNRDPLDSVYISGFPANQGVIYTHPIRDMFSICSKRIDIHFEDTKAYLTFLDDKHPLKEAFDLQIPDKIKRELRANSLSSASSQSTIKSEGRDTPMSSMSTNTTCDNSSLINRLTKKDLKETAIKTAVYVAVAMRNHREINKEIPKVLPNIVDREMKKTEKFKTEEQQTYMTFRVNRVFVPHIMTRMKLSRLDLPTLDSSEMEIRVTWVETPSLFYAQYAHPLTKDYMNKLSAIISYDIQQVPCESEVIEVGDLTIGEFIDSKGAKMHGRARIDNIEYKVNSKEVDKVFVFFIDYGVTKIIDNIKELCQLCGDIPNEVFTIPPQAFRCALSEVNPSPISCFDSRWSKKSIEYFKKWVQKRDTMTAKIYSVINRVVRVELFDNINREESFNDMLVAIGMAEKWEESPQSKLNHELRRKAMLSRDDSGGSLKFEKREKGVYDPDQVIELEMDFNPNDEKTVNIRSHEKIRIKGPYSPLECSFTGLTRQTSYRSVQIEKSSVNCVVLEPDYLSKHTRLLVASSMGLGQNSGCINLRDTTLMPNIRGFPSLMALLFAPRVQLRANKEKTQYVGAITGLGYNKQTMKAYDPEYDAEILFDSEISLEDMIKVNIIRYNISTLMMSRNSLLEYTEGSLAIKQRKVRRNIIELLDRRRRLLDGTGNYGNFKWSDITTDDVNSHLNYTDTEINKQLLPLCEMQKLDPFDYFKDIENNLKQLNLLSEGKISVTTKCQLCKFTGYTRNDVSSHILSDQHMDAIKDFQKLCKINLSEKKKEEFYKQRLEEGIDEEDEDIFDVDDSDDEISIIF